MICVVCVGVVHKLERFIVGGPVRKLCTHFVQHLGCNETADVPEAVTLFAPEHAVLIHSTLKCVPEWVSASSSCP